MADITVQRGQGVTQAIASNLGLSTNDCKNIKLSIWQQVMTLVDKNNSQALKIINPRFLRELTMSVKSRTNLRIRLIFLFLRGRL